MTAYTVHEPEGAAGDVAERAEQIVFVKEGFAWWALVVPVLWLLFHRMWLVLAGFVVLLLAAQISVTAAELPDVAGGWMTIGMSVLLAVAANDLRRWTLARNGYRELGAVTGRNYTDCEEKFFSVWLEAQARGAAAKPVNEAESPATRVKQSRSRAESGEPEGVIGLFPEPDR